MGGSSDTQKSEEHQIDVMRGEASRQVRSPIISLVCQSTDPDFGREFHKSTSFGRRSLEAGKSTGLQGSEGMERRRSKSK